MFRPPAPRNGWRLLLSLLALLGLLGREMRPSPVAGTAAPNVSEARLIEALGGTLCHADGTNPDAPAGPGQPSPGHAPDCAVCPLCASLAAPVATLARAPALPLPRAILPRRDIATARPRAPPPASPAVIQPRAPPSQA